MIIITSDLDLVFSIDLSRKLKRDFPEKTGVVSMIKIRCLLFCLNKKKFDVFFRIFRVDHMINVDACSKYLFRCQTDFLLSIKNVIIYQSAKKKERVYNFFFYQQQSKNYFICTLIICFINLNVNSNFNQSI